MPSPTSGDCETAYNAPFSIEEYIPPDKPTRDLVHAFYAEQEQINGGKMDRYAAVSDAKGLVMGYYHTMNLPLAAEALKYTLCDRFFHGAFGGPAAGTTGRVAGKARRLDQLFQFLCECGFFIGLEA